MSCTLKHCSQATGFEKKTGLGSAEAVVADARHSVQPPSLKRCERPKKARKYESHFLKLLLKPVSYIVFQNHKY